MVESEERSSSISEDDNNLEISKKNEMSESEDDEEVMTRNRKRSDDNDNIKMYAEEVITLGLIYSEYSDAIREGDGDRVMRIWKFLMLIFKAAQRKNYACEAFNLLAQQKFILSQRLSQQVKWSRFINARGGAGNNIPADLHMEHLNRVLKDGIKGLGANKTDRAITRLGKCIDSIDEVLNTFDEYHQVRHMSDYHTEASAEKDIKSIVEELTKNVRPFSHSIGRGHRRVKVTNRLMKTLDTEKFHSWMNDKWRDLYWLVCFWLHSLYMVHMHVYAYNCCTTHMLLPDPWPLINLYLSPLAKFIIIIREYYRHNYHIYKLACIHVHHNIYTQHYMVNAHICRSHRRVHLDSNTCLVDNSYSWFCPQNVLTH